MDLILFYKIYLIGAIIVFIMVSNTLLIIRPKKQQKTKEMMDKINERLKNSSKIVVFSLYLISSIITALLWPIVIFLKILFIRGLEYLQNVLIRIKDKIQENAQ